MQVTALRVPPWTVLDAGELQLKLQLSLLNRLAWYRTGLSHTRDPLLTRRLLCLLSHTGEGIV